MQTTFQTIANETSCEFKDRGSRFIAYSFVVRTIEDAKKQLRMLKELHPKAVHHCVAYRIGHDGNVYRAYDDGEPSGSAGKPILGQIDHFGLCNVMVVVVRYFGGVLLGVPGLINAYKTVTHDVLQASGFVEKNIEVNYLLQFNYTLMNEVMRIIKQFQLELLSSEMTLFCEYTVAIPVVRLEDVLQKFQSLHELSFTKLD